jgi:hypothetical protein
MALEKWFIYPSCASEMPQQRDNNPAQPQSQMFHNTFGMSTDFGTQTRSYPVGHPQTQRTTSQPLPSCLPTMTTPCWKQLGASVELAFLINGNGRLGASATV